MNKVPKTGLPHGGTEWDRGLIQVLDRYFQKVSEALNQAADGYLHDTTSVATSYTASLNNSVVLVNTTAGDKNFVLPGADDAKNKRIVIKNTGANDVLVTGSLIEGVTVYTVAANASLDIVSDGTNWWAV